MFAAYPKINGLYKRGEKGKIIDGQFSLPVFEYLRYNQWVWTEKIDGTNIRLGKDLTDPDDSLYDIGGRTDRAQIPSALLARLIGLQETIPWRESFPDTNYYVTLYGEGYGAGIQKGGGDYIADSVDFVLFDVRVGRYWLSRANVVDIANKLGIDVVPTVQFDGAATADICTAEGFVVNGHIGSQWQGVAHPEGIVGRPAVDIYDGRGKRITVKIKRKDYR